MGTKRYTDTFKLEAVRQVTEGGHGVYDVSNRLGVSSKSLSTGLRHTARSQQPHRLLDPKKMKSDALRLS